MTNKGGIRLREIDPQTHPKDEESGRQSIDICYAILGVCTLSIYLVAQGELNAVDQKLVPRGDAFTYSVFLYEILNKSSRELRLSLPSCR